MKKKTSKISKWEKEWKDAYAEAKAYGDPFSLPLNPVLGRSGRWTPAKRKAVLGKIVEIGWADSPAQIGFCYKQRHDTEIYLFNLQTLKPNDYPGGLNPDQVRAIYELSEYERFSKRIKPNG